MELTLKELGEQYEHNASLMTDLIRKYNQRMHMARRKGDCNLEYKIKQKLCDLYLQRDELRRTATHLIHYYDIH